jgi:DNA-binding NarL/FixJ family response regulator
VVDLPPLNKTSVILAIEKDLPFWQEGSMSIAVLIMDDAAVVRKRIVDLLSEVDDIGEIIQAEDVTSAIRLIEQYKPLIVILDIQVPGSDKLRNGIDVLQFVARLYPSSVVIMLSNYSSARYREECKRAGARFFFDKSSEFDHLPAAIRDIMQTGV